MIWAWVMSGFALAGQGELSVLAGMRTAPEASLEQPSDWEPKPKPTALTALQGSWLTQGPSWWGAEGDLWGLAPETDSSRLSGSLRGGVGTTGATLLDVAGRVEGQLYPGEREASSVRSEVLARAGLEHRGFTPLASINLLDRSYPWRTSWSFRAIQPNVDLAFKRRHSWIHLGGGLQGNVGWTVSSAGEPSRATGRQIRAQAGAGWSSRRWNLWTEYGFIAAREGQVEDAERSQFTPIGAYSEDADVLSSGGFRQHRLEVGASIEARAWTLRGSGLLRLRDPEQVQQGAFSRTLHAQLDLEREIAEQIRLFSTVGLSQVEVVHDTGYLDAYLWMGFRWRPNAQE